MSDIALVCGAVGGVDRGGDVSRAFAWNLRTDVANWNDVPATFMLDGPFADGSEGPDACLGQRM
jgi:hypothetical protein